MLNGARVARKIEADPSLHRCPNPSCSKEMSTKTCKYCGTQTCQNCSRQVHKGPCPPPPKNLTRFPTCHSSRKCPSCRAKLSKEDGCPHMRCPRCSYNFCWCCMGEWHQNVNFTCPRLPYDGYCATVCVSFIVGFLLPVIIVIGLVVAPVVYSY